MLDHLAIKTNVLAAELWYNWKYVIPFVNSSIVWYTMILTGISLLLLFADGEQQMCHVSAVPRVPRGTIYARHLRQPSQKSRAPARNILAGSSLHKWEHLHNKTLWFFVLWLMCHLTKTTDSTGMYSKLNINSGWV